MDLRRLVRLVASAHWPPALPGAAIKIRVRPDAFNVHVDFCRDAPADIVGNTFSLYNLINSRGMASLLPRYFRLGYVSFEHQPADLLGRHIWDFMRHQLFLLFWFVYNPLFFRLYKLKKSVCQDKFSYSHLNNMIFF